jgi:hypothetical protein
MQQRDYTSKVTLQRLRDDGVTEAVGALTHVRGEVTIIDGHTVMALGPSPGCSTTVDSTCLVAAARVARWSSEPVTEDVPDDRLRSFIAARAGVSGLDLGAAFPFRFRGSRLAARGSRLAARGSTC